LIADLSAVDVFVVGRRHRIWLIVVMLLSLSVGEICCFLLRHRHSPFVTMTGTGDLLFFFLPRFGLVGAILPFLFFLFLVDR